MYNQRIVIDFTDPSGRRHKEVHGIKKQACDAARYMNTVGYHINEVRDEYTNQTIDWDSQTSTQP